MTVVGSSVRSAAASARRTGRMAGGNDVYRGVFDELALTRDGSDNDHIDPSKALGRPRCNNGGKSSSGLGRAAVLTADRCGRLGLQRRGTRWTAKIALALEGDSEETSSVPFQRVRPASVSVLEVPGPVVAAAHGSASWGPRSGSLDVPRQRALALDGATLRCQTLICPMHDRHEASDGGSGGGHRTRSGGRAGRRGKYSLVRPSESSAPCPMDPRIQQSDVWSMACGDLWGPWRLSRRQWCGLDHRLSEPLRSPDQEAPSEEKGTQRIEVSGP